MQRTLKCSTQKMSYALHFETSTKWLWVNEKHSVQYQFVIECVALFSNCKPTNGIKDSNKCMRHGPTRNVDIHATFYIYTHTKKEHHCERVFVVLYVFEVFETTSNCCNRTTCKLFFIYILRKPIIMALYKQHTR